MSAIEIPFAKPVYYGKEISYVTDAVASSWISDGPYIEKFEGMLKEELGVEYLLTTSNGTTALMLAFMALGLMPGDEIIVPGYCFQAAANVALQMGIKPVFVDVDLTTYNILFDDVLNAITNKTRAIVLVNNYGNTNFTYDLKCFTNIPIIEDCAESIFSKDRDAYCGTYADISTYSFHATKTLTTGEGGAFATKHEGLYEMAKLLRSHGLEKRGTYNHLIPGNNFRMTNIQAALGVAQLENLERILTEKERILSQYILEFKKISWVIPQRFSIYTKPIVWSFPVRVNNRDFVLNKLKTEYEIETRPGFVSAHKLKYFDTEYLPNSDILSEQVLVLPAFTSLTNKEISYIANSIKEIINGRN